MARLVNNLFPLFSARLAGPRERAYPPRMMCRPLVTLFVTGFFLTPGLALGAETAFEQACAKLAGRRGQDAERLRQLFKLEWDYTMHDNPEFATEVGYP